MAYGDGTKPYQRPDGRWAASIEVGWSENGKRRRRWVTAKTKAECARKLRNAKREINSANATSTLPNLTVKRWADEWLPIKATELRPKAYASLETHVTRWIVPNIGQRRIHDLTPTDVRKIDAAIKRAGLMTWTTINVRRTLTTMLKAALVEGYTVPPSVLAMPLPKKPVNNRRSIPLDDVVALLRTAIAPPHPAGDLEGPENKARRYFYRTDGTRWLAALLYGQRQGESLGMTWSQIDFEAGVMDVDRQLQYIPPRARAAGVLDNDWYDATHLTGHYYSVPVKSRAGDRLLPMLPIFATLLESWRDRCPTSPYDLVWPRQNGGPWSVHDDMLAWQGLQDVAGIHKGGSGTEGDPWVYWVPHEARHSVATLLMVLKIPAPVIISIMGHSSIASTLNYQHADMEQARQALAGMAGLLQIEAPDVAQQ